MRVWDADGNAYTDLPGEYSAGLYGHSNPAIEAAVKAVLDEGLVLCAPNRLEAEFAGIICERFPSCERVRFRNSGTEGSLMALGAVRAFTGRTHVMVFDGAYHGGLLYFLSGGSAINAPYPVIVAEYNDLEHTSSLIEQHAGELAAILIEPLMGAGGCIPADPECLRGLRAAADRHGIVLIFDEFMASHLSSGGIRNASTSSRISPVSRSTWEEG